MPPKSQSNANDALKTPIICGNRFGQISKLHVWGTHWQYSMAYELFSEIVIIVSIKYIFQLFKLRQLHFKVSIGVCKYSTYSEQYLTKSLIRVCKLLLTDISHRTSVIGHQSLFINNNTDHYQRIYYEIRQIPLSTGML